MRMFIAAFGTETNTFSPLPTGMRGFQETMLAHGNGTQVGRHPIAEPLRLWRTRAEATGHTIVESLSAFAEPAGPTGEPAFVALRDEILDDLANAGEVDLILLSLHGAMVARMTLDAEGDLLARVRKLVGSRPVIGVEFDLHCQLTSMKVTSADVIVTYKEYPHTDIVDRAAELYDICIDTVEGRCRPVLAVGECEINAYMPTTRSPMTTIVDLLREIERRPGILSASLAHGFPHGDVDGLGARALVVSDGRADLAQSTVDEIVGRVWEIRERVQPDYVGIDEAIDRALRCAEGPVVIADTADNAGCGAPADSTFFLEKLLEAGIRGAVSAVHWDPLAVAICEDAGEGAELDLRIGGRFGPTSGHPLDLRVKVGCIQQDATQTFCGFTVPMGTVVRLAVEGVEVLLTTRRFQVGAPDLMSGVGIDVRKRPLVVVKSTQHFHFGFGPVAAEVIYATSPGCTNPDTTGLTYKVAKRPAWPIMA